VRILSSLGLTLALFVSTAIADDTNAQATSLIQRAKQLSDIRAEGSPAYRLKLNIKVFRDDGSVMEGGYTEVWVSNKQWRRETVLGDFRRTEVAVGKKRWLLDSTDAAPERVGEISAIYAMDRLELESWKPEKVKDTEIKVGGLSLRCLIAEHGPLGGKSALCFDKSNGALALQISPFHTATRIADKTCSWTNYEKFGDRLFARSYACDEDRHRRMEAKVVELVADPAPDAALFAPLAAARELFNCPSMVRAPRPVRQPEPVSPATSRGRSQVVMQLVVGSDGKPADVHVMSAPNPDFDHAAVKAVRQWTFEPATCDGQPVETEITVEMNF
jgi:TonB family protein